MGNYLMRKPQSKPDWPLYHSIPLPKDKDGFTKSFNIENCDLKQVKQFYNNFGVVVFENVIDEAQIQRTIDDLWTETQSIFGQQTNTIDRNDPKTWNFKGMQKKFGFVGYQPLSQPQIWQNRSNPKVYKIFKTLYELTSGHQLKQPLIACFDRGSMIRPSKLNPKWQTWDIYHFDIDPWLWTDLREDTVYKGIIECYKMFEDLQYMLGEGNYTPNVGFTKLAGVLALSDTNEDSGGFQAALGFQNYIKKWCQKTEYNTPIDSDPDLLKTFQKVTMRKGSLMIFSRQLPHNIYANKSENFRYAQYLRMVPESSLCLTKQDKLKRKQLITPLIPQKLQKNQIVKEIYMLDK